MGHVYSAYIGSPETAPDYNSPPTFDPLYGFPEGRKERQMVATPVEMEAAGLTLEQRDYCAHHLIEFMTCRKENFPWVAACKPQKHKYDNCKYDDYVLRMKEYERERRLLERAKRKGELESHKAGKPEDIE